MYAYLFFKYLISRSDITLKKKGFWAKAMFENLGGHSVNCRHCGDPQEAWPSSFQAEDGCEKQQNVMHMTASGLLVDF